MGSRRGRGLTALIATAGRDVQDLHVDDVRFVAVGREIPDGGSEVDDSLTMAGSTKAMSGAARISKQDRGWEGMRRRVERDGSSVCIRGRQASKRREERGRRLTSNRRRQEPARGEIRRGGDKDEVRVFRTEMRWERRREVGDRAEGRVEGVREGEGEKREMVRKRDERTL